MVDSVDFLLRISRVVLARKKGCQTSSRCCEILQVAGFLKL